MGVFQQVSLTQYITEKGWPEVVRKGDAPFPGDLECREIWDMKYTLFAQGKKER